MSTRMRDAMLRRLADLRHEPTEKRIRVVAGGDTVVDTTRAMLVWEPRRVVPSYAVPVADLRAELVPAASAGVPPADRPALLHPGIPFAVHSSSGEALTVRVGDEVREAAAFRPDDPDLSGYVILDFPAFDAWYEEDDRLVGHPRDPFHRVDIRPGSRLVRVEFGGRLLAESSAPVVGVETNLPTRFYLPREDIRAELRPSARRTYCAYKGEASYRSIDERQDLAWTYEAPLPDAARLTGLIAFFDELVDVTVDGDRRKRPRTALAKALLDESGVGAGPR
jgi:uncharacterized protein (DUF427 family)